jgi:diguanylate cyclase (GGDEF)-like protein
MRLGFYSATVLLSLFVLLILTERQHSRVMAEDLQALNDEVTSANDVLEYMSRYDPLTNVANRRYFDEILNWSWATCLRLGAPLSILMVDMDNFKSINDKYGHATGDACLVRVATLITKTLRRADDIVARFGGEEFIVMAVGAEAAQADALAEKIRAAIAGTLIEHDVEAHPSLRVTASVGVSTAIPRLDARPITLCSEADKALYTAKKAGRNRICHYSSTVKS